MDWFVLAILAGISSNIFNTLNRYLLKDGQDGTAYAWGIEFMRLIFFGILAIFP